MQESVALDRVVLRRILAVDSGWHVVIRDEWRDDEDEGASTRRMGHKENSCSKKSMSVGQDKAEGGGGHFEGVVSKRSGRREPRVRTRQSMQRGVNR